MNAVVALVCAAAAFACALADSAGLRRALDGGRPLPRPEDDARHRAFLFARVVAHLAMGAAVARALAGPLDVPWQRWAAVVAVALAAVAVTEAAARELGDVLGARGPAGAARFAAVGRVAEAVLAPALWPAARLDAALGRLFPSPPPDEAARDEVAEQFREIVAAEAEGGAGEGALVAGVFELGDTQVSEVMVPRVDVLGVERTTAWAEVVARVTSAEHSRLPVYDETIDDIEGVLYAKDVLTAVVAGDEPAGGWTTLVRPAQFVPATKRVDDQLRDFRATGNHLAVVADEYGGTAGIVTIEDVLEEIVGEIRDERDDEEPPLEGEDGRRFWVSARVTLDDLSDALGYDFRHDDVSTVGGLVYEVLGRVPRNGERLNLGPYRVIVERVVRRKIQRLYFEQIDAVVAGAPAARRRAARPPRPARAATGGGRPRSSREGRPLNTLVVAAAVVAIALLTAGSTATRVVSRIWLRHWVERRLAGAEFAERFLERPQRLLVAAGSAVALAAFVAGAASAGGPAPVVALRVAVLSALVLLVGQLAPRALARRWPTRIAPALLPVLRAADVLTAPARAAGARLAASADRRAAPRRATPEQEARADIEGLLRDGQLEGVSETEEMAIITGVVQFGEKRARDVLTPRDQVFALDVATPPGELAAAVARAGYSRVPVYRGTLDDVVGIVHAFDVLKTAGVGPPPVRPAYVADADARCNVLLSAMLRTRRHLAVVRDGDARTLGILTLEDLLEELVGEIRDEHDDPESPEAPRGTLLSPPPIGGRG